MVICCCEPDYCITLQFVFFSTSVWVGWAQLGSYSAPHAIGLGHLDGCLHLGTRLELVSPRWASILQGLSAHGSSLSSVSWTFLQLSGWALRRWKLSGHYGLRNHRTSLLPHFIGQKQVTEAAQILRERK